MEMLNHFYGFLFNTQLRPPGLNRFRVGLFLKMDHKVSLWVLLKVLFVVCRLLPIWFTIIFQSILLLIKYWSPPVMSIRNGMPVLCKIHRRAINSTNFQNFRSFEITIFHCTSSTCNPFRWKDIQHKVNGFLHQYPLKSAVWYVFYFKHLYLVETNNQTSTSSNLLQVSALEVHF